MKWMCETQCFRGNRLWVYGETTTDPSIGDCKHFTPIGKPPEEPSVEQPLEVPSAEQSESSFEEMTKSQINLKYKLGMSDSELLRVTKEFVVEKAKADIAYEKKMGRG